MKVAVVHDYVTGTGVCRKGEQLQKIYEIVAELQT